MMRLTTVQLAFKKQISDYLQQVGGDRLTYHSEWLGYLPYGYYQWLSYQGQEIPIAGSWSSEDLQALVDIGFLVTKEIQQDPEDALTQTILYDVNLNP